MFIIFQPQVNVQCPPHILYKGSTPVIQYTALVKNTKQKHKKTTEVRPKQRFLT